MSVLAACSHKAEWICQLCARCAVCCGAQGEGANNCPDPPPMVHINTRAAALALASWARRSKLEIMNKKIT